MTSERMGRMMGDPPYRADAYADVTERIKQETDAQQERVAADQHWRAEYVPRIRRELLNVKPPTIQEQVRALWDAGESFGAICEQTRLSLAQVSQIVSEP